MTSDALEASALLETATVAFASHRSDTQALLSRALDVDANLVTAHCLRGFLLRLLGRRDVFDDIATSLAHADASLSARGGSARERAMTAALCAWCEGAPMRAATLLEACLEACPTDLMSLKLAHAIRFMSGDLEGMTRALERTCARLETTSAAYGYALGMRAFVLEESGAYDAAERVGHEALAHTPCDVWGAHAVLHVHAARGSADLGLSFLETVTRTCGGLNNFAAHMVWHRALFHIARRELDAALALYDTVFAAVAARDYRDFVNTTSLLVRLEREGMDVGDRWARLADVAAERRGDHGLAFADAHYVLALARAGRRDDAGAFVENMRSHVAANGDHDARVTREVGLPLVESILGKTTNVASRESSGVAACEPSLRRLGGSNLQRSLFAL